MKCTTCNNIDFSFEAIVKRKKEEYEKKGIEYHVYRKDGKNDWSITRTEYFQDILAKEKPNEYFHISEFKPD